MQRPFELFAYSLCCVLIVYIAGHCWKAGWIAKRQESRI